MAEAWDVQRVEPEGFEYRVPKAAPAGDWGVVSQTPAPAPQADPWTVAAQAPATSPQQDKSWLAQAIEPITNYPSTYTRLRQEAQNQFGEGIEEFGQGGKMKPIKAIANTALGALNYTLSPINAALESIAGQPIENVTGLPKEYTDFTLGLALPVIGMAKTPKTLQRVFSPDTMSAEAVEAASLLRSGSGRAARDTEQVIANVEPYRKIISQLPDADRLHFMGYIEGTHAAPVQPQLQQLADVLRKAFEARKAKLQSLPPTSQARFVDDYFPHFWTDPNAARQALPSMGGPIKQGSGASLKARSVPTIEEGIRRGLTPVTTDPIEAALRYVTSMDKFIAATEVLHRAKEAGLVKYFRPRTMGASGHPDSYQGVPPGWVRIEGRGATDTTGAVAHAPEDFARVYNNFISKGFHDIGGGEYGRVYDVLRHGANTTTQMLLSLSGYHAFTIAEASLSSQLAKVVGAFRGGRIAEGLNELVKYPFSPVTYALKGRKARDIYLGKTAGTAQDQELVDLITQAGGRMVGSTHALDYQSSALGSYYVAFKRAQLKAQMIDSWARARGSSAGPFKEAASHIGRIMDTLNQPIFQHYIPLIKNGAAMENMAQWIKANPGATQAEKLAAARKIVDSIDNRFGEMIQDNIFWNKFAKQSAQLGMLSYSWSMGGWRELGGGVRDAARGVMRPGHGAGWSPKTDYVVGMALNWAVMSAVYQHLKTGEYPKDMQDLAAPRTGGIDSRSGLPERMLMPGIMKDVYGYYEHPLQEAGNKLSVLPRHIAHTLSNSDWRGDPVFSPREAEQPFMKKAPDYLQEYFDLVLKEMTPITVQNTGKGREEGSNISAVEKAIGMRTAPRQLVDPEGHEGMMRALAERRWFGRRGRGGKLGHDQAEQNRYGGPQ